MEEERRKLDPKQTNTKHRKEKKDRERKKSKGDRKEADIY